MIPLRTCAVFLVLTAALGNVAARPKGSPEVIRTDTPFEEANKPPQWPLWHIATPRPGAQVPLPAGSQALGLDVDPTGRWLAVLYGAADEPPTLSLWDFKGPLRPGTSPALAGRRLDALTFSKFGSGLYVISHKDADWRIDLLPLTEQGEIVPEAKKTRTVYRGKARLDRPVSPFLRYDGAERLFFGREYRAGLFQILGVRADGTLAYELTSPTGTLSTLTDAEFRGREEKPTSDEGKLRPEVESARSALPVSLDAITGALTWLDAGGGLHRRTYGTNWERSTTLKVPRRTLIQDTPNAFYRLRWTADAAGAELLHPDGQIADPLAGSRHFVLPPVMAPSGRSLIGAAGEGGVVQLVVEPVATPLAAVRYLGDTDLDADGLSTLGHTGLLTANTGDSQIYQPYDQLMYSECHDHVLVPIFASLDGFLEVLDGGFQTAFMLTEQQVSRPRLEQFLKALEKAAGGAGLTRVAGIAKVAHQALDGHYASPEGKLILAERSAPSSLHTVPRTEAVEFADFHPRGPYTGSTRLKDYFRAFKYINLLNFDDKEREVLGKDQALAQAYQGWIDTQRPFLSGSRHPALLGADRALPPHVRAQCVPPDVKETPQLFPLSWGIDSEIWGSTVQHTGVPAGCSVTGRLLPNGLDLLTALGSPTAQAIQKNDPLGYAAFPELKSVHEGLKQRFAQPLRSDTVPEAWLRLVQLLGDDAYTPDGVSPDLWHQRLLQSALASWTTFRHTTVLVNEQGGAECGGGMSAFETAAREPARGAVDPVPQSWRQLGAVLRLLAQQTQKMKIPPRVAQVMGEAAESADAFGSMAERQMKGEPLTATEYSRIQTFAGEVEHPFKLLKTALKQGQHNEGGIVEPEPMMKIVSVQKGGAQYFQMAVGTPIQVKVLL